MTKEPSTPLAMLAFAGDFGRLEEAWMAAVESGHRDLADYYTAADITAASGRPDVAGPLLGMLLEALRSARVDEALLDFALNSVLLALGDPAVRQHASAIHAAGGREELGVLLAAVKGNPGESTRERILLCLKLRKGTYVSGTERVGPERVLKFDTAARVFHLTDGNSDRTLTPEEAAAELTLLPDDDFRARLRFDVDSLVALAESDPAALVAAALRSSNNRLEWSDLKKLLARGVVAPTAYARWWNKTKGLVERHPMIQVYGDRQPTLILREKPITHEEELRGKLLVSNSSLNSIGHILAYLKSVEQGHDVDPAFITACAEDLATLASSSQTPTAIALVAASVFDSVQQRMATPTTREIDRDALIARAEEMSDAVQVLQDEDLVRRALVYIKEHAPTRWPALYARTLPTAPGRLTESLAKELLDGDRSAELGAAIQAILKSPDRCGEGLLWLFKTAVGKKPENAPVNLDPVAITLAMLRLMNRWARAPKSQVNMVQKALLTKMRNAVAAGDYSPIERLLPNMSDAEAKQIYDTVKDNLGLNDANRHHIATLLLSTHEEAILGKKELWEQDAIYVTPTGLRSRQMEFEKIINVEMVKNSEAIGHAADFGDLSENAEFTAALEQRDFLSRRANEIGAELRRAVLIPDDITNERVNVGTRITVSDAANNLETLTFLGPWDVDLDAGIFSYLAPFARAFMGSKVGDSIESQGEHGTRKLKIEKIERVDFST